MAAAFSSCLFDTFNESKLGSIITGWFKYLGLTYAFETYGDALMKT